MQELNQQKVINAKTKLDQLSDRLCVVFYAEDKFHAILAEAMITDAIRALEDVRPALKAISSRSEADAPEWALENGL